MIVAVAWNFGEFKRKADDVLGVVKLRMPPARAGFPSYVMETGRIGTQECIQLQATGTSERYCFSEANSMQDILEEECQIRSFVLVESLESKNFVPLHIFANEQYTLIRRARRIEAAVNDAIRSLKKSRKWAGDKRFAAIRSRLEQGLEY